MTDSNRMAIFALNENVNGNTPLFIKDAAFVGSQTAVQERVLGSKQRREALNLINDAAHAKRDLASIRQRERDVAAREDSIAQEEANFSHDLLGDFIQKLDALAARIDAMEQQQIRAKLDALPDPDDPGSPLSHTYPDPGALAPNPNAPSTEDAFSTYNMTRIPSLDADTPPGAHFNSGDLHSLPPTDRDRYSQDTGPGGIVETRPVFDTLAMPNLHRLNNNRYPLV
jgi:hypothetical protein